MARALDLVRDSEGDEAFELLLFFAVATVLGIRAVLHLTGYPQIGGGNLHIAHMLWGGLFMLAAITLLLVFWNPAMRRLAAVIAGIGFGFFIDELGKFITNDNDYFFKPTAAILYVLFLGLWGFARWLRTSLPLDVREQGVNTALRALLVPPAAGAGAITQSYLAARAAIAQGYRRLVRRRGFARVLSGWFLLLAVVNLASVAAVVADVRTRDLGVSWVQAAGTVVEAGMVWLGWIRFRRSRIAAYRWFQRSLAVSLLVVQVGHFYTAQFWAINGVILNVLLYLALTGMMEEEHRRTAEATARAARAEAPATP